MPALYSIGKATVAPLLRLGWRPEVDGLANIPPVGGAVLAGNHLSVADEIFLGAVVPRHVAFWARAEYFDGGGLRGWLSRGLVAVYPEGTRSPDGRLHRGRTGAARLALAAGVPVVPVGILGTDRVQPIGARWPRLRRGEIVLRIGKPMGFAGRAADSRGLRAITDEVMAEIQKLTGQEYVPRYAVRPGPS